MQPASQKSQQPFSRQFRRCRKWRRKQTSTHKQDLDLCFRFIYSSHDTYGNVNFLLPFSSSSFFIYIYIEGNGRDLHRSSVGQANQAKSVAGEHRILVVLNPTKLFSFIWDFFPSICDCSGQFYLLYNFLLLGITFDFSV